MYRKEQYLARFFDICILMIWQHELTKKLNNLFYHRKWMEPEICFQQNAEFSVRLAMLDWNELLSEIKFERDKNSPCCLDFSSAQFLT